MATIILTKGFRKPRGKFPSTMPLDIQAEVEGFKDLLTCLLRFVFLISDTSDAYLDIKMTSCQIYSIFPVVITVERAKFVSAFRIAEDDQYIRTLNLLFLEEDLTINLQ